MIELLNITKKYGDREIFKNLNYVFEDSKKYLISGESGVGKTTLLRTISGVSLLDKGLIKIDKEICTDENRCLVEPSMRNIGYVFQNPVIYPHINIFKNISLSFEKKPSDREKKIDSILNEFGIMHLKKAMPQKISTGEAKRVALAMVLAKNPKYILLDEPLANLDKDNKKNIIEYMKKLFTKLDSLLIYVSHSDDLASELGATELKLENGKLKEV